MGELRGVPDQYLRDVADIWLKASLVMSMQPRCPALDSPG